MKSDLKTQGKNAGLWALALSMAVLSGSCTIAEAQTPGLQDNPFSSSQTQNTTQDTTPRIQNQQPSTQEIGPRDLNSSDPYSSSSQRNDQNTNSTDRNGRNVYQNPLEPVPLTAFQRMVADSVGRVLPIFGSRLFSNVPSTFAPVDRIPVTPDYVIGPGDELLVRVWGQVVLNGHFTVDRSGNIYIPQVGTVTVAGIPFSSLTDHLRSQIGRNFRNFDLNVNIGQLRSIQVFVTGDAKKPGSFTISSLSTLVNALFECGGPTPTGSMRNIQVKRGNQTVVTFDLYDLLRKGDKSKDVPLLSGDVIYIPPAGTMVAVAGSVDTPALYELKPGDTIQDLFTLSGGLSTLANKKRLRIERLSPEESRSMMDVTLDQSGLATPLRDGDIIEVSPIVDRFKNAVTLRGNVADPRRFSWFPGMRIKDIIPEKEVLLTRDYWQQRNRLGLPVLDSTPDVRNYAPDAPVAQINGKPISPNKYSILLNSQGALDSDANVYGKNIPTGIASVINPQQQSRQNDSTITSSTQYQRSDNANTAQDAVLDSSIDGADANSANRSTSRSSALGQDQRNGSGDTSASGTSFSASVTGAARRFPVKNSVVLSAPEVDWAYAVVERLNPHDLTTQLLPFDLGKVVLDGDPTQNLELQPGDVITIFSKADIRVPQSQQTKYVRLEGEFSAAGTYSVEPGETLRHLIARTGGLTNTAYLFGANFSRESTRVLQQQRLNDYAADLDRRIKLAEANAANNTLNPQDQIADIAALQNARTVAMRLRELRTDGRIVLNVRPDSKTIADIPDLPLEDGDAFVVPQVPMTVDVFGAVYTQTSFLYDSRKRATDYIHQAGGGTRTADIHRSYIVRADGSIISSQFSSALFTGNFGATHLYPGDAVVVPESVDRRPLLRNLVDIATIVGQFGLGIAAINVLK